MKQYNYIYDNKKGFEAFLDHSKIGEDSSAILIQIFSSQEREVVEKVATFVQKRLPQAVIVGSSTAGEIASGAMYESKTILSISLFEKTKIEAHYAIMEESYALGEALSRKVFCKDAKCVITFLDGLAHHGDAYLQGLESGNLQRTIIAGGIAGDLLRFKETYTLFGERVFSGGAVCVTLCGEDLEVYEDYNLGWRAVGPSFRVTKSDGARVYEINNRPIKEVYAEVLGEFAVANMPASTIEFPLLYEDNGILIARSMLHINSDGSILYGGNLDEGEEVHFGLGSRTLVNRYNPKKELQDEKLFQSCFIYSCVARKKFLERDLEKTFRIIEQKAPSSGFFTYGEFFYCKTSSKLLNVTTTLLFLREKGTQTRLHREDKEYNLPNGSKTDSALFHFIEYVTQELHEQEKKFQASKLQLDEFLKALESVVIISRIDRDGKIIYVNSRLEEISGYPKEELLGQGYTFLCAKEIEEDLVTTITHGSIWKGELSWRRASGKLFYTNTSIIPIHDENDEIVEYMAVSEDVTTLVESKQKAEEAEAAQAMFLANMSHEIRTPMNGILGFSELLAKTQLNQKQEKYLNIITSSTKILLEIVNDILDASKINQKKIVLEEVSFNPLKEFQTTFELLKLSAEEKSIEYLLEIDSRIADSLVGDPTRLRQVLINLLSNAIKFTPKFGKVKMSVGVQEENCESQRLHFSIEDSGIGIAKEKREKIFKPFAQADTSTTREFGGTGLGLSISSELVKAFGGVLEVDSQEKRGSKFYFDILLQRSQKLQSLEKEMPPIEENRLDMLHLSVLVAEDYEVNRALIESIFEHYRNISLDFAFNGQEAIEKLEKREYDLVLMDINMPVKNGMDATREIRQKLKLKIPIVALSANALEGDAQKFLECGMDDYLSKPIDIKRLEEILQKFSKSQGESASLFVEKIIEELHKKVGLGEEVAKKLLRTFLESLEELLPEIHKSIVKKDVQKVYEVAHKLKGASASLYINSIYEKMQKIEDDAQGGVLYEYEDVLVEVAKEMQMIEEGIDSF